MTVKNAFLLGLCLALSSSGAFAAAGKRAGSWHTGEFSEPQ